jgi:hypothetical protein
MYSLENVCYDWNRKISFRIRRHCNEYETLSYVLVNCEHGNLLRNSRHHRIRTTIANALRNRGLTVYEEVHCNSDAGSRRRVDIVAFDEGARSGFVS